MGLLIFVLVLPPSVELLQAQPVRFGLEVGAGKIAPKFDTYHNLKQVGWHEPQSRLFFNGMILLDIPLQKRLALQPGLRFRRFGTSVDYNSLIVGGDVVENTPGMFKITQAHLSVPLRVKYRFDEMYIWAGPELIYLLSASVFNRQRYEIIGTIEFEGSLIQHFNRTNLALNLGLGYEIRLFQSFFYVQAQYSHGITNLSEGNTYSTFVPWIWRLRELNLSLGYLF